MWARTTVPSSPLLDGVGVMARRLRGYRRAMDARGVRLPDESILSGPASVDGGIAAFGKAQDSGLHFTAVLAMSDVIAIGAMHAAQARGLDVPRDISLVGFDNIDESEYQHPPLTTVHQPVREKGAEAARLLLAAVDRRDYVQPEHRVLETRLITRGSTAPLTAADRR